MVTARRRHRDSLRDSSSDSCPVHVRCGDDKAIAASGWRSLQHQSRDHSQRQSYVDEYHPKRLHKICVWARLRGSNFRTGLDQIQGGPFRYRRASSPDTPREQLLRMLQALLADRLKLVLHHEQRERSFLALVVGKGGSKLRPASSDLGVAPGPMILGRIVSTQMLMLTGGLTIALRAADSHRYDGSPGSIRCRSAVDFGERRRTDDQRQAIHLHRRSRTTRPEA